MTYTLGERIEEKRKSLGLSQQELGNIFNPIVKRASISKWESGMSNPDIDKLPILARKFKTTIDWLITGKSYKPSDLISNNLNQLPKLENMILKIDQLRENGRLTNSDLEFIDSMLEANCVGLLNKLAKPNKDDEAKKTA